MGKTLVLATGPFDTSCLAGLVADVVPLTLAAFDFAERSGMSVRDSGSLCATSHYQALKQSVDALWAEFLEGIELEDPEDLTYIFSISATPLTYWSHVIQDALEVGEYEHVIVTETPPEDWPSQVVLDWPGYLRWCRKAVLRHNLMGLPVTWVPLTGVVEPGYSSSSSIFSRISGKFLRLRPSRLTGIAQSLIPRWLSKNSARSNTGLLIAQTSKSTVLGSAILQGYLSQPNAELAPALTDPGALSRGIVLDEQDPVDGLFMYLSALGTELDLKRTSLGTTDIGEYSVLVTDHEYHPVVRDLIRRFIDADKPVLLIPEGAQSLLDAEILPFARNWFVIDANVTRACLDQDECRSWQEVSKLGNAVVTGYLGDTHDVANPVFALARGYVRVLGARYRTKGVVFVNFDAEDDSGLARCGLPTLVMNVKMLDRTVAASAAVGALTIVSAKSAKLNEWLRARYASEAVVVAANWPWQAMAMASDVVIQRDSSIGVQARALGIRVIVFDPWDLPLASRQWVESAPNGVTRARSDEALVGQIRAATQAGAPLSPDNRLHSSNPAVFTWLQANVNRPEPRHAL